MNEISQNFLSGINQSSSRSNSLNPDFFYSLKNARVLQDGNFGEVKRIKGYTAFNGTVSNVDTLYDIINVDNLAFLFYKTDAVAGNEYSIVVVNNSGTVLHTFTYTSDIVPTKGELKQYDDTIFVAPHNKIVYDVEGTYYIKDFISSPTKINDITTDDLTPDPAEIDVTFNSQLSGFAAREARGYIRVYRNNLPAGVSDTVNVSIDGIVSTDIVITSSMNVPQIVNLIADTINADASYNTLWRAEVVADVVNIYSETTGSADNEAEIDVINRDYIKVELNDLPNPFDDGLTFIEGGPNFIEKLSFSLATRDTFGGQDANTISGAVKITLKNAVISDSINILSSDTTADIANKVETILNSSPKVTNDYTITRISETMPTVEKVKLTAKNTGKKYNTDFILTINDEVNGLVTLPDSFYTVTTVVDAADAHSDGTLEQDTLYWYTARVRYIDGHITSTCSPRLVNSGANAYVTVTFDVSNITDLDGTNLPRLQIFRKEAGEEFFLIREINLDEETVTAGEYDFIDTGYSKIQPLDQVVNVWTKQHKTQEILENRLVKANVKFFDEEYSIASGDFTISKTTDTDNNDVAPYNSKVELYVRPQYTDGTLGFFTEIDRVDITAKNQKLQVTQNNVLSGTEKEINELRFYGNYLPYGEEFNIQFNTIEIQTPHLEGIANPDIFPSQTKVFYGYKHILVLQKNTGTKKAFISVEGWEPDDTGDKITDKLRRIGDVRTSGTIRGGIQEQNDDSLLVNVHGTNKTYVPIATSSFTIGSDTFNTTVYKLEEFEALKEAISTGELYVRLNRSNEKSLSETISDDELIGRKVKVIGLDDKTINSDEFNIIKAKIKDLGFNDTGEGNYLLPPEDGRLYLVLEPSSLDEIDNRDLNNYQYQNRGSNTGRNGGTLDINLDPAGKTAFEIINFQKESGASFTISNTITVRKEEGEYEKVILTEATYFLINRNINFEQGVIYLGKKTNTTNIGSPLTLDTTGFVYNEREPLNYSRVSDYNIYETLVLESDFNFNRTDFTNQLVWGNPLLVNNYFAGGRNFDATNFFNIPTENGEIIDIVSLDGNLFVFCERGVARLLIGETLTQQKGGSVFVDSSRFITKSIWVLENISDIDQDSIVKYEGRIYFCNGDDVYAISGQGIDNISEGVLNLDDTKTFTSTIVPKYNEYRLSNGTETFVYNTKYKQWYGPFTYLPEKTIEANNKIISWIDGGLMQEDQGNTFNGTSFTTIIQSVANDTEIGAADKTYRKFYIDVDGDESDVNTGADVENRITNTTFKYGKDFSSMVSKALDAVSSGESTVSVKNGWYHFGVEPDEGNTKKIYWDIESTNSTFSLRGFVTAYMLRRRR